MRKQTTLIVVGSNPKHDDVYFHKNVYLHFEVELTRETFSRWHSVLTSDPSFEVQKPGITDYIMKQPLQGFCYLTHCCIPVFLLWCQNSNFE